MLLNASRSAALGARIRELVEDGLARKGVSARKASMDVVGHDGLIRDIRAGRVPSFDRIVCLFEYLSIPLNFGMPEPVPGVAEDGPAPAPAGFDRREALRAGFLPFPWHRATRRQGMGPVAFSNAWLAERGLAPENLSFVVSGRALAGPKGALALVDQAAPRGGGPALWGYLDQGVSVVASLNWQDRETLIVSGDRPETVPQVIAGPALERLPILGRVVWLGHWVGSGEHPPGPGR